MLHDTLMITSVERNFIVKKTSFVSYFSFLLISNKLVSSNWLYHVRN